MSQAFENCVKKNGRVRTKKLKGGKYMHICFLNGKSYAGEIKRKVNTTNGTMTIK